MEQDAVALTPSPSATGPVASPREQLVQQLTAGSQDRDGGIFAQLTGNPLFTAGFGLAALGTTVTLGLKGFRLGAALLRRRLLVDVEITRADESYHWFLKWMSEYHRAQLEAPLAKESSLYQSMLRRFTPGLHHLSMETAQTTLPNGATHTRFALIPGPGRHILRYKHTFISVERAREKTIDMGIKPFETIRLTTLYAHRTIFESLFKEAHDLARQDYEGKTTIYTSFMTEWKQFGEPKRKRPLNSVVLEKGVKEQIVQDVEAFLDSRSWYTDRGIPYRRGYLLYGPPGTGKSSFIEALAGELDFNIAMLNLSERGLTDDRLNHLLSTVPRRTLVLLEDADAAWVNRSKSDEQGYRGATVTFSGLLNALDGVASADERIIFLTTNHIERLDEALVRPGRVDMTVRLGEATEWQVEQLWDRFYSEQDPTGALRKEFVSRLQSLNGLGQVSTAALQGLFLFNKDNARGAVDMVQALLPAEHGITQASMMQQAAMQQKGV